MATQENDANEIEEATRLQMKEYWEHHTSRKFKNYILFFVGFKSICIINVFFVLKKQTNDRNGIKQRRYDAYE